MIALAQTYMLTFHCETAQNWLWLQNEVALTPACACVIIALSQADEGWRNFSFTRCGSLSTSTASRSGCRTHCPITNHSGPIFGLWAVLVSSSSLNIEQGPPWPTSFQRRAACVRDFPPQKFDGWKTPKWLTGKRQRLCCSFLKVPGIQEN